MPTVLPPPAEVRFRQSRNGYDMADVDALLDQIVPLTDSLNGRRMARQLIKDTRFHLARSGYDAAEVDHYLDRLVASWDD